MEPLDPGAPQKQRESSFFNNVLLGRQLLWTCFLFVTSVLTRCHSAPVGLMQGRADDCDKRY